MTAHDALIAVHAAAGALALVAGVLTLPRGRFFATYLGSMTVMELSLVLAVAAGWSADPPAARTAFVGLIVLGAVMCARAGLARRERGTATSGPSRRCVQHVGFTLVGLVDAFVVVAVLRAGAPPGAMDPPISSFRR